MRTAAICPTCATYTNAVCVVYDGPYLATLDIAPLTNVEDIIEKINAKIGTLQPALGFTPENVANKSTNTSLGTSNTLYPTQNAVRIYVNNAIAAIPTPSAPTLQQVLTAGNSLSGGRNFQGTSAGIGNTGNDVIGFGLDAGGNNTGSDVTAFGTGAAQGNQLSGVTVFSNLTLPTYANHAAAVLAITVPLGATAGCTYLYHNQATNSIGAVRL